MRKRFPAGVLALSLIVLATAASAEQDFDGILGVTPVGEHSCVAVALRVSPGEPIGGLAWIHNDASAVFPNVMILEGEVGAPPDLSETALVIQDVSGESLGWGEVTFETPITTSATILFVVFQLPAFTERTSEGLGGGPGLGYVHERRAGAAYASVDGSAWTRLHPDFSVCVHPVVVAGKAGSRAQSLAELHDRRPEGWWTQAGSPVSEDEPSLDDRTPNSTLANGLRVVPNPFNPRAIVQFSIVTAQEVAIDVYDVRGRRVKALLRDLVQPGVHEVVWPGMDDRGRPVASGVYLIRMQMLDEVLETRATLVR